MRVGQRWSVCDCKGKRKRSSFTRSSEGSKPTGLCERPATYLDAFLPVNTNDQSIINSRRFCSEQTGSEGLQLATRSQIWFPVGFSAYTLTDHSKRPNVSIYGHCYHQRGQTLHAHSRRYSWKSRQHLCSPPKTIRTYHVNVSSSHRTFPVWWLLLSTPHACTLLRLVSRLITPRIWKSPTHSIASLNAGSIFSTRALLDLQSSMSESATPGTLVMRT